MALEDDQRNWLNAALKGKGRIKSSGIKKEFENYKRRRKKVADVFDALPSSHSNYIMMQTSLAEADKHAKGGDFKAAYKSLERTKALAKATDAGTSGRILENEISQSVKLLENTVSAHVADVDQYYGKVDQALDTFRNLVPCSTKGSFDEAIQHRKTILALEPNLRGTLDGLIAEQKDLAKRFDARKITKQIASLREEFTRLGDAGHGAVANKYAGRVDAAETTHQGANGKYDRASLALKHAEAAKLEAEKILLDRKNLDDFVADAKAADKKAEAAKAGLKSLDVFTQIDQILLEEERMERMRDAYLKEKAKDAAALAKTGAVDMELTPEPPQFQAGDVLDDLNINVNGKLKDDEVKQHADAAGRNLTAVLKDRNTPQSVLLDLMSKSLNDIGKDVFNDLFPGQNWADISKKQQALVGSLAKEMFDKINSEAPNKVSADAATVQLGDQSFNKVKVLKAGGLGTATLFEDPATGKKMVMKTPNAGNEEAYQDLLKEMKIMNRAQEGAVGSPNKSAIPELYGAARGEDGSMHMLMEFIDGGDMKEVGDTMAAIGRSGFLPEAALNAMEADMIGKAATALGELQRQGLMHHDVKGLNIMMTKTGDVRIIDYGESTFVGADGTAKRKDMGNSTPGYDPIDALRDGGRVNVDNFALGSMLVDMVEQRGIDRSHKNESDTGALGRLIQALHKDADQRVSLEGLAESAFMTAAETDFGEEAMSELRKAATEFTQETKSIKSEKDYDEIRDTLKDVKFDAKTEVFTALFTPDKKLGLDDAQDLAKHVDNLMEEIMRDMQSNPKRLSQEDLDKIPAQKQQAAAEERQAKWLMEGRKKLEDLAKAKAYVQTQIIDEMLDTSIAKSEEAYQKALDDKTNKIDVDFLGRKKTVTLKEAVAFHKKVLDLVAQRRKAVITWLETATGEVDEIQDRLDDLNADLMAYDTAAKRLKAQIEEAAGPGAKLRFAKERLDAATVPFGPSEQRRKQQEVEEDALKQLDAFVKNIDVNMELEAKVAKDMKEQVA